MIVLPNGRVQHKSRRLSTVQELSQPTCAFDDEGLLTRAEATLGQQTTHVFDFGIGQASDHGLIVDGKQ
jgi:hypothetical protein